MDEVKRQHQIFERQGSLTGKGGIVQSSLVVKGFGVDVVKHVLSNGVGLCRVAS
jgi:hypothetical protein